MPELSIIDIARIAGVSTATVSRCINSPEQVREKTRKKIQKVIEETGYSPNTLARDFRRGNTRIIIVVVPNIGNEFFSQIMEGIRAAAKEKGYSILIQEALAEKEAGRDISNIIVTRNADGIILLACLSPFGPEVLSERHQRALPVVIGCETLSEELSDYPSVHIDNLEATKDITNHLIDAGHTSIGFIHGEEGSLLTRDRELGYQKAMSEAGLTVDDGWVTYGELTHAGVAKATAQLLKHEHRPTAIICANDEMAIACLHNLRQAGLNVPEDMSVVGIDNIPAGEISCPPLTTVSQPKFEIGERVVKRLIQEINREPGEEIKQPEIVEHRIVIRDSVAPPKQ